MMGLERYLNGSDAPDQAAEQALVAAREDRSVFIATCDERARFEADLATRRYRAGQSLSPLDGITIGWKDLIDVAGVPTTGGTRVLGQQPAQSDAPLVNRLTQCGAITIGKTNLSELAYSGLGLNPHYGTPPAAAPGNQAPGGSSSGSAVAVARSIVQLAMGSDTAGSLRVPAAFNGLYAFRPSIGWHPMAGAMPLALTMDTLGFMARHAEDVLRVEQTLNPRSRLETPTPHPGMVSLAFDPAWLEAEAISPEVRIAFGQHVAELRALGIRVNERPLPILGEFFTLLSKAGWLGGYEAAHQYLPLMQQHGRDVFDARVWDRMHAVADHSFDRVITLQQARKHMLRALPAQLGRDLLLLPTVAHTAPDLVPLEADSEHFARVNLATLRLTMFGSFLDTPAFALPAGTSPEGQHCSVQWLAPQGENERLLEAVSTLTALRMRTTLDNPKPQKG